MVDYNVTMMSRTGQNVRFYMSISLSYSGGDGGLEWRETARRLLGRSIASLVTEIFIITNDG